MTRLCNTHQDDEREDVVDQLPDATEGALESRVRAFDAVQQDLEARLGLLLLLLLSSLQLHLLQLILGFDVEVAVVAVALVVAVLAKEPREPASPGPSVTYSPSFSPVLLIGIVAVVRVITVFVVVVLVDWSRQSAPSRRSYTTSAFFIIVLVV